MKKIILIIIIISTFIFSFSLDEVLVDVESVNYRLENIFLFSGTFLLDGYVNSLDLSMFNNVIIEKINSMGELDFLTFLGITSFLVCFDDPYTSFTMVESVGFTSVITYSLKMIIGRGRPNSYEKPFVFNFFSFEGKNHSFPSGHSAFAWALFTPIAERYGDFFYLVPFLFSFSRLVGNYHWLSDVVFGALIGYSIGKSFYITSR
ncbi:PA-phosphatase [Thermosipho affectus]|uniref:PA-phosphatase n=1 Tax=Thermosipho affectus TaxID=660294 RepID=A0ABX3IHN3_9BACT|nr:phosphatase PAP2 family protein [Thermosipho affectus]ONN26694.1 PA-phosphatase [Thermosipho affectus]